MPDQLTAEQQRMIEENRRKALERRALRLARTNPGDGQALLQPPRGASELANSKLANVTSASSNSTTATAAAAAPKQFVAPVKQCELRVDAPGNRVSHAANFAPNEVSFSVYSGLGEHLKNRRFHAAWCVCFSSKM